MLQVAWTVAETVKVAVAVPASAISLGPPIAVTAANANPKPTRFLIR
jgi:hypothetical protein